MLETKIISSEDLLKFGSVANLNEQVLSLVEQQKVDWKIAAQNYDALNRIKTREFDFGYFKIVVQYNPERIRSSAAKTDAKSIAQRACFLCLENLPPKQKGILFQNSYLIITNPYPIFTKHLTIVKLEHTPQRILPHFHDLLNISKILPDFTIFYNGPQCGASAPDHFHFQGGNSGYMPLERELSELEKNHSKTLIQTSTLKIFAVENFLRRMIVIVSSEKNLLEKSFGQMYNLPDPKNHEEPMMNVLCKYSENQWFVIIFPREKQRPSHYFREDKKQLLVSPASVEMGGILILPHEDDFLKITKTEVAEIYNEVTMNQKKFNELTNQIKNLKI